MARKKPAKSATPPVSNPAYRVQRIRAPGELAQRLPAQPGKRLVLGLDLATNTGFAGCFVDPARPGQWDRSNIIAGQISLKLGDWESRAAIVLRLRQFLEVLQPVAIFMEEIKYTPGQVRNGQARMVMS